VLVKEAAAECLTDTRPEMKSSPLGYKVSVTCPLLKVDGKSAQLIYPVTVIIFESQHTSYRIDKCLVKLKFQSYIALVGERKVTFRGGAVGYEIEQQHEISRYKHIVR